MKMHRLLDMFRLEPIHPPAVDWHEPIRRNILGDTTERRLISAREHVRDGPLK